MSAKGKPIPSLPSDEAAERFVATADLSDYDLSGFKPMRFEIAKPAAGRQPAPSASVDNRTTPPAWPGLSWQAR